MCGGLLEGQVRFGLSGVVRKKSDAGLGAIGTPRWIDADLPLSIRFNEHLGDLARSEKHSCSRFAGAVDQKIASG